VSWSVGAHRIEYEPSSGLQTGPGSVIIDECDRMDLIPQMPIKLSKVNAKLAIAYDHGVLRPALWIGNERVPATPTGTQQTKAPEEATCPNHGTDSGPYRSSGKTVPAKITCPGCARTVCLKCAAVDRVLCHECFEKAHEEERWLREAKRRRRAILIGVAVMLTAGIAIAAGNGADNRSLLIGASVGELFGILLIRYQLLTGRPRIRLWKTAFAVPALPKYAIVTMALPAWIGPDLDREPVAQLIQ
jgi:hypothetical protein